MYLCTLLLQIHLKHIHVCSLKDLVSQKAENPYLNRVEIPSHLESPAGGESNTKVGLREANLCGDMGHIGMDKVYGLGSAFKV